nr:hypothetical protein CFP56_08790 [Quercus suber]
MKADGLIDKEKLKKQTSVSSSLIPTIAILSSKRTEAPKKAFLVGNSHKTTRLEKQENYSTWLWYSSPVILKLPHSHHLQPPDSGHQKKFVV